MWMTPIFPEALKQLFTEAHTHNGWLDEPVPDPGLFFDEACQVV